MPGAGVRDRRRQRRWWNKLLQLPVSRAWLEPIERARAEEFRAALAEAEAWNKANIKPPTKPNSSWMPGDPFPDGTPHPHAKEIEEWREANRVDALWREKGYFVDGGCRVWGNPWVERD